MKKILTLFITLLAMVLFSSSVLAVNTQLSWDDLTTNHREFTIGENIHYIYYVNTQTTDDLNAEITLKNNDDLIYDVDGNGYTELQLVFDSVSNTHSINGEDSFSTAMLLPPYFENLQAGEYTLTATGWDSEGLSESELTFTLKDSSNPTQTLVVELFCPENVEINTNLVCDVRVTDLDGNLIQDALATADIGLLNNITSCTTDLTGFCTITYPITEAQGFTANTESGIYVEATKTSYNPGYDYATFNIQPTGVVTNNAPYWINAYDNQELLITQGTFNILNLVNNADDPDDDVLSFYVQTLGNSVSCNIQNTDDLVCTLNNLGQTDIILEVTDGELSDFTAFSINVMDIIITNKNMSLNLNCQDEVLIGENLLCNAMVIDEFNLPVQDSRVVLTVLGNQKTCITSEYGTCALLYFIDSQFEENQEYVVDGLATKESYNPAMASEIFKVISPTINRNMSLTLDCEDEILINSELTCNGKLTEETETKYLWGLFKTKAIVPVSDATVTVQINNILDNYVTILTTDVNGEIIFNRNISSVVYLEGNNYLVSAEATKINYNDAFAQDSFLILEQNETELAPVAIINAVNNSIVGQEITFDGSASYADNDSVITSYTWSITDTNGNIILSSWSGSSKLIYKFNSPNTYLVKLNVVDSDNLFDEEIHKIIVYNNSIPEEEDELDFEDLESGLKVVSFTLNGFDDGKIHAGEDFELEAIIENIADEDIDNVRMSFYLPEYGIEFTSSARDFDKGDRKSLTINGYLPYDIEPNVYYPLIGISDDHIRRVKIAYMEVIEG